MTYTHETAPTQFVEANGIRFAYRRFGKAGGVPTAFNQHFQGTLDHWTENSYVLQQTLQNAQFILYPDANHGSFYQHTDLFIAEATLFLDR